MDKGFRLLGVGCLFVASLACAEPLSNPMIKATPLTYQQLSSYRGGFQLKDNYVVNIGLSITTAVNGQQMFNTQIANLVIENGHIKALPTSNSLKANIGVVNVTQVGEGNSSGDITPSYVANTISSPLAQESSSIQSSSSLLAQTDVGALTNIVQNSLNNSVIGMNTIVDVDAQVSHLIKNAQNNVRLKDALLMSSLIQN
ncbi:hypothetical protein L4C54_19470 [Vibrio lamellibrachiae]|uniref:hypothetical protein n=1 Tax=Vibrio lamellibrachiae TaxID=2910253 RepID=UPI003D108938